MKCIALLRGTGNNSGIFSFQKTLFESRSRVLRSFRRALVKHSALLSYPDIQSDLKLMVQRENVGLALSSLPTGPEQRQNLLIPQQVLTWKPAGKCILHAAGAWKDQLQALEGKGGGGSEWLMSLL